MAIEPRHRLATMLSESGGGGTFSARRTAPAADLDIEVAGVGPIRMPVTAAQARQLVAIARPARYGRGEQTLTDARVRDTWEVPKSRVRIDKRRWNRTLHLVLDGMRDDLGLPDGSRLGAELHSVLVYTPGQFFVPHQDSEKADDMVGTLTVTLPGSSKGGELVVEHAGEQAVYRSSATRLSFVAFYADCRHEVRPVTAGYRIVLTYNLLLSGAPGASIVPDDVDDLTDCLAEHFVEHDRLIYLLDHEYTPRGLSWTRLKGVDAERVSALRAAGQAAGCEVALALADVHESWDAYEPREFGRHWRSYGNDEDDDPGDEDYELRDLLFNETALTSWIDINGAEMDPIAASVGDDEVCAATSNDDLTPYESEYQGFMGNYGNTLDRWYHRGAVVLWPRSRDFAVRAEVSPAWALDRLAEVIDRGDVAAARDLVDSLGPWGQDHRTRSALEDPPAFGRALLVAVGLADADRAAVLLGPFRRERITPADAPALVALVDAHGLDWLRALLRRWGPQPHGWYRNTSGRAEWLIELSEVTRALIAAGGAVVPDVLIAECWAWLAQAVEQAGNALGPSQRAAGLDALVAPAAGLLVAASAHAPTVVGAMTKLLDDEGLLTFVAAVLQSADERDGLPAPAVRPLRDRAVDRLAARLARPVRNPDDWSITPVGACPVPCRECRDLDEFLLDPARRTVEWARNQQFRTHIEERLRRYELPVEYHTIKSGRPYTIALAKSPALLEREAQQRLHDRAALVRLQSAFSG